MRKTVWLVAFGVTFLACCQTITAGQASDPTKLEADRTDLQKGPRPTLLASPQDKSLTKPKPQEATQESLKGAWLAERRALEAAAISTAASPPAPRQGGEDCASAVAIGSLPFSDTGTTVGYTDDYDEVCPYSGSLSPDVVYSYTPGADECVNISLCTNSDYDTKLYVYEGACPGTLTACNDDSCSTPSFPSPYVSELTDVALTGGSTYYIIVDGYGSGSGNYTIDVTSCGGGGGPAHDECANAICVEDAVAYNGDTTGATGTDITSCAFSDSADVWHSYTAASDAAATFSLCGSGFDTTLAIFDACGGAELACNDDSCGLQSEIAMAVTAGTTYLIRVSGYNGATGSYTLTVTGGGGTCVPVGGGDECADCGAVGDGTYTGTTADNTGATDDTSCAFSDTIDEWYCYTASCDGMATASLCGSAYDTTLAVFDACGGTEIACNDDSCGLQSELSWTATAGTTYYVRISGYNGATGDYTLTLSCTGGGGGYCTPCFSNCDVTRPVCVDGAAPDDWITNVTFNTINHDSDNEPCPCSYADYTDQSTNVALGSTHTLSVTFCSEGIWTQYVAAWFDWDQSGTFDPDEYYQIGSGVDATVTADITVPVDAASGCTVFRVIERYSTFPTDPCEIYSYGEAEDYEVCVGEPAVCGDGVCEAGQETCDNCPADCGDCFCGNGTCDANEDCASCEQDCGVCPFCGDGNCDAPDEDCANCEQDCGPCTPDMCPVDSLFSQPTHQPGDAWSAGTSDQGPPEGYLRYESYTVDGQICDIHFWGLDLFFSGGWLECSEDPMPFEIKFYQDAGGLPGAEVCSYSVSVSPVPTGLFYAGFELNLYSVDLLAPCCQLTSGWVSIQGAGDPNCWFLWMSSGTGDGHSWFFDGVSIVDYFYDLSVCLTGEYVPTFGACCDDSTGVCEDNIEAINCTGRFAADTLCADLVPACGEIVGACCYPDGTCAEIPEGDCIGGQWLGANTTCDQCPCIVSCPPGGIPEGEPDCADEYNDTFNGGCNSTPPVFSPINCGDTVCGTGGTFMFTGLNYRDTDWYEVTLTEQTTLTWTVEAEFPVLIFIIDGSFGCDNLVILDSTTAGECQPVSLTACVPAGTYWLWVGTQDFSGIPCGSDYTATLDCVPCVIPTGACCLSDASCVPDQTADQCTGIGGVYQGDGTDCASVECPVVAAADLCEDAVVVAVPSSTLGDTSSATIDSEYYACDTSITSPGVWFRVTGTGNTMTATTCGDFYDYDTKITVYCDGCSTSAWACIAGNDDNCPGGASGLLSTVTWCSEAGTDYLILVHGFGGGVGMFILDVFDDGVSCGTPPSCAPPTGACCVDGVCIGDGMLEPDCAAQGGQFFEGQLCADVTCPQPCAGDTCADAFAIGGLPFSDAGNTCTCINDYDEVCPYSGSLSPDVVYAYTPATSTQVSISLCTGSDYDTKVYVYENTCPNLVACNDDSCSTPNFPSPYVSELDCVPMTAGNTYYIVVDGYAGDCGNYTIDVSECVPCDVVCPPGGTPENEPLCGTDYVDTTNGGCNSTPPVFSPIACGETVCGESGTFLFTGLNYRDTDWYEITVTEDTEFTWTVEAEFDVLIGLVETIPPGAGDCAASTGSVNPYALGGSCEVISVTTDCMPPGTYWFFVAPSVFDGVPCGVQYTATLTCVTCTPPQPPENDDCVNATAIGEVADLAFDTTLATFDGPGSCMTSPNIWYCYTPTCTGSALISLCGSSYDTKLAVYKGCVCDPIGEMLACNDDSGPGCSGLQSSVRIDVVAGTTYLIEVGGYSSNTGAGILNITCQCGDLDTDGDVDAGDYALFAAAFGHNSFEPEYNVLADYDLDGIVSLVDYQTWMQCYRDYIGAPIARPPQSLPGDMNWDGDVDLPDFVAFASCFTGAGGEVGSGCLLADLDGDGDVDLVDFTIFANNFGASN